MRGSLTFKEKQHIWDKIDQSEHEHISEEERQRLEALKLQGEFIAQEDFLKEEISESEIQSLVGEGILGLIGNGSVFSLDMD